MSVSFENTATNRGVVTFTIGQDKIQAALDQAFNKVKKNLNCLLYTSSETEAVANAKAFVYESIKQSNEFGVVQYAK